MSFLNPLFLFGLAAAALPIIIHLFTRRRPKERPFPSLEFLSEVNQSEIRRVRIKQWLLLLLRTLAVSAIALAMARPALKGAAAGGAAATSVVVLVDRSGSMGATAPGGGRGTLLAEARRVVEGVLATLGPEDELLLLPYDRAPQPATPRPSSDLARVRAAAQSLEPSAHPTDHVRALEFAATALSRSTALNRELYWVSDFQLNGFAAGSGAARVRVPDGPWSRSRQYLIPMASQTRPNAAVTDAALTPSEGDAAVSVTVTSHGVPAGDLAVEVLGSDAHSSLGRGFVDLPERGEATTLVPVAGLPQRGGIATIPDDALPLDNRRAFAAGGSGALRVVLREDGSAPSPLRLALEAGSPASGLVVEVVTPPQVADRLRDADLFVVHDVPALSPSELQAALDFHRAGGALLLVPGIHADAAAWNASLLSELNAGTLGALQRPGPGGSWRLLRAAAGHPALAGFETRPGEPLSSARFQAVRALNPGRGVRVLLEFDRGHPALVEATRAMVFTAPLDPGSSDLAVSGAFLPLMHQMARVLARGTAAASLMPGDRYTAPAATGEWRIEGPGGRDVPSELVEERGATRLVSAPLEAIGLYSVLRDGTLRSTFAVNPDPRESDLTIAGERELINAFPDGRARILRPGADLARRVREARYGRELWSWFVILALTLLVAETFLGRVGMASRAPITSREPEPALKR